MIKEKKFRKIKIQNSPLGTKSGADADVDENMELTMFSAVNTIINLSEDSKLSADFFKKADRYISFVADFQGISKEQALFLSLFIEASACGGKADFSDISRFLDCNNIQVLQYKSEVEGLVRRGMLRMTKNDISNETSYVVPQLFLDSMSQNEPFKPKSYKGAMGIEFFQYFYDITHLRYEDELSSDLMLEEFQRLMDDNADLPYVKALREEQMQPMNQAIITHMCRHLVLCGTESIPVSHLVFLYDTQHHKYNLDRDLANGSHYLICEGWLENSFSEGFKDRSEYRLTERARERLLSDYDIKQTVCKDCNVLQSDSITVKQLYFTDTVKQQLDGLVGLLSEEHYQGICDRLKKRGLRQGFACLFYGAPGTGKTESVLQIAQKTGRDIMQVNISQLKSMWVGESEKNVKALFDRYRVVAKHSKRVPILLFNEADAVIGKRQEGADRAVDKMENSIQNIILQEMESLEGIMIATTNLVQNMDAAFERRFLYKVKFEKPDQTQRRMIWQSMMPTLSDKTAERLASAYDFSGGQIENITRKCDIASILYGDEALTDEKIDQYCQDEKIQTKGTTRIGFK